MTYAPPASPRRLRPPPPRGRLTRPSAPVVALPVALLAVLVFGPMLREAGPAPKDGTAVADKPAAVMADEPPPVAEAPAEGAPVSDPAVGAEVRTARNFVIRFLRDGTEPAQAMTVEDVKAAFGNLVVRWDDGEGGPLQPYASATTSADGSVVVSGDVIGRRLCLPRPGAGWDLPASEWAEASEETPDVLCRTQPAAAPVSSADVRVARR